MLLRVRAVVGLVAFATLGFATQASAELVFHNGFAECWDKAITKPMFFSAAQSSVDGLTGCVPPQSGTDPIPYAVCNTAGCAGGQMGCQVTMHAPTPPTGDFNTGAFSGTGTADNLSVPITYTFGVTSSCVMQITGIGLTYAWTNTLQADGNNGKYSSALATRTVTFNAYTIGGNCGGTVNGFLGPAAVTNGQTAAATAIAPNLTAATTDESVCPLTP